MGVLRPRNRLVNFRLSEDEFDRLTAACAQSGARSLSDFARSSVLDRMQEVALPPLPANADSRISHLDDKVHELESRVGELLNLLSATGAAVAVSQDEMRSPVQKLAGGGR